MQEPPPDSGIGAECARVPGPAQQRGVLTAEGPPRAGLRGAANAAGGEYDRNNEAAAGEGQGGRAGCCGPMHMGLGRGVPCFYSDPGPPSG